MIRDFAFQGAQMLLVLVLSPLLTGFVRKAKAYLLRRQGPPLLQPYRDLVRLMRKEVVLAENASWLFRVIPYIVFAGTWVAASLVPTFRGGLLFSWSADLIALIALLGSARFFLALAGLDVGTSFGGIGSSREMMIASLAEPAMLMIVFTLALIAGSTQLSIMAAYMVSGEVGLRVSLGLALLALIMVAIAENARIPIDNPATHLELTMVHEAMVLEYSGRHLALIDLSSELKLLLYLSVIACLFVPWGIAPPDASPQAIAVCFAAYLGKLAVGGVLLAVFETSIAKMRVFRVPAFLGAALMLGLLATLLLFVSREPVMRGHLSFDVAHLLAGSLVLVSFMQLYQDRLYALLNIYALHALVLAGSVAWQAFIQDAPHLYLTAMIALVFKAIVIPAALHRIIVRLGIHREIETVGGVGPTMLLGMGLVALSMVVMLRVTSEADPLAREDLAFALSVVLLGLLMMVTRRNAVSQVVGFMSLENGLVLAATGAKGMPLVVEISVAFSVLIAFIVIGIFLFRIRERFRHSRRAGARPFPRRAAMIDALAGVLVIPAVAAALLATLPGYRLTARLNVLAALFTFLTAASLFIVEPRSGPYLLVDDLNKVFIVLTTFVGFTTSVFSASYIGHEIEIGRLTPTFVRFYHAMYQTLMFAMNLALVANNIGLMWVAIELANSDHRADGWHLPHP